MEDTTPKTAKELFAAEKARVAAEREKAAAEKAAQIVPEPA